ncbi:MAG TPA: class I SAM-dependent methyltransferase [Candidatus Paceibacterota bacterium]|nr:class I SAM-dependent methyltransferase [Candidatus Paceibacterota bacterium]
MAEGHRESFWKKAGEASDFNAEWKEKVLNYIGKTLRRQHIPIGDVVLDIGSGINPVSRFITPESSKVIYVDFNAPESTKSVHTHINRDIHDLLDEHAFSAKRALVQSAQLLEIDPRNESREQVDTVFVSDILNYVPAQQLLGKAYEYLKQGGVLIVLNQPGRTFEYATHTLHPEGASDNAALGEFLTDSLHMTSLYSEVTKEGYFIGAYQKIA